MPEICKYINLIVKGFFSFQAETFLNTGYQHLENLFRRFQCVTALRQIIYLYLILVFSKLHTVFPWNNILEILSILFFLSQLDYVMSLLLFS